MEIILTLTAAAFAAFGALVYLILTIGQEITDLLAPKEPPCEP